MRTGLAKIPAQFCVKYLSSLKVAIPEFPDPAALSAHLKHINRTRRHSDRGTTPAYRGRQDGLTTAYTTSVQSRRHQASSEYFSDNSALHHVHPDCSSHLVRSNNNQHAYTKRCCSHPREPHEPLAPIDETVQKNELFLSDHHRRLTSG